MITGNIKQIETMGLVDGPGVRVVIFMQGCPLRCLFCHNPEMQSYEGGTVHTPEELIKVISKYRNYFDETGGVTFSGGEPLSQPEFLIACLKLCKKTGINTVLDTSGVGSEMFNKEILSLVDLVIFDIKALNDDKYRDMTNTSIGRSLAFLELCQKLNKRLWIRNVIVPGINDTYEYVEELGAFIKSLKNIEKVELLPYHTMGVPKYRNLDIPYHLENTEPMNAQRCKELEEKLRKILE